LADPLVLGAALVSVGGLVASLLAIQRHRARGLSGAASRLGLHYDPEARSLSGLVAGIAVGAGPSGVVTALESELGLRRMDSHGRRIFRLGAELDPPLDLGLSISRRGLFGTEVSVFARDHEFEHRFATRVDEPHRARALIDAELRAELSRLSKAGHQIWLSDGGVLIEPKGPPGASELIALLETSARIGGLLEAARPGVVPAKPVESVLESWRALAAERDLRLSLTPLRLRGDEVSAETARIGAAAFEMRATARFVPPLDVGLAGKSTDNVGLAVSSARDVTTGDLDFDTVFDLEARDEETVRAALGPELRRALLELAKRYAVTLDDLGITLRARLGPAHDLAVMLDGASAASRLLGRSRARSGYR
jgi:hypothetical protein